MNPLVKGFGGSVIQDQNLLETHCGATGFKRWLRSEGLGWFPRGTCLERDLGVK